MKDRDGAAASNGSVRAVWLKRARRGPMDAVTEAELVAGSGIRGNADQGGWRQVTVIAEEAFRAIRDELSPEVEPSMRRANVMVEGLDLEDSRGKTLVLGECRVLLRGETRPCERMDEAHPGLRSALDPHWRGGAFGKVVRGGMVRVGDPARLEDATSDDVETADRRSSEG